MSQAEVIQKVENGTPGHADHDGGTLQSHTLISEDTNRTVAGQGQNGSDRANKPKIPPPPVVQIHRASEADGSGLDESGDESSDASSDEHERHGAGDFDEAKSDQGEMDTSVEPSPAKEWKPPDDALVQKIIKQVEFYFSDANIVKDAFLLKHVRRNKQGYVSIKLIASFKKVRSLSKDWKAVCFSLKQSEKLQINNEGTKVKRIAPLPEYDETSTSRTVVAVNLPMENPNVEKVSHLFQTCGEISLVRIIRPGNPIPQDVRKHMESHVEYSEKKACALIEFERTEAAHQAAKTMNDKEDWRSGLHVSLLVVKPKQKERKERKSQKQENLSPQLADDTASVDGDGEGKKKKRRRKKKRNSNRLDELSCDGSGVTGTPSSSDVDNPSEHRHSSKPIPIQQHRSPNHLSPANTPKSSPCPSPHGSPRSQRKYGRSPLVGSPGVRNSPKASPKGSPELSRRSLDRRGSGDHSDSSASQSPWIRRRMLAAQDKSPLAAGSSPCGSPMMGRRQMADLAGVLRSPGGPGSVAAFYGGKGRGKPPSEP
ncbi:la-related protein 6-like [Diadema antillarum]|uniref:la-related protein 6-like n=1 Tax=Diadema antillarum TaxID=105358 RepID=UPI003A85E205